MELEHINNHQIRLRTLSEVLVSDKAGKGLVYRASNVHAPWPLLRTCTQSYMQNNWSTYFLASGCRHLFRIIRIGARAKIRGTVHLTGKEVSRTRRAERERLLYFSFADIHRTLAVLFSSSHCEHWCFLGRCYPLLRTTSCGRGVLWVVTKGMERDQLRERSVGTP
jgi:hypothetical protein